MSSEGKTGNVPEGTSEAPSAKQGDKGGQDGQAKLWTTPFVLLLFINFFFFFAFNLLSVGMPVYVASLGGNDVVAGLTATICTTAALLSRPFVGYMLDRFGRKGILLSSLIVATLAAASFQVFPIIGVILVMRFVHGFVFGTGSSAVNTMAADVLPQSRFAEGMGYIALATSISTATAPALAIELLNRVGSLPMFILAIATGIASCIMGIIYNGPSIVFSGAEKPKFTAESLIYKRAILPSAVMAISNIAFGSVSAFIALWGNSQGVEGVSLYFVAYAVVCMLTRPVIGRIIDRKGFYIPGILAFIGVSLTMALIACSHSTLMFCVAGVFAGLGIGTAMGTMQTMAVVSAPAERRGVATSTYFLFFDVGVSTGSFLAGVLASSFGYANMYFSLTIFPIIGLVAFLLIGKERIASYQANQQQQ